MEMGSFIYQAIVFIGSAIVLVPIFQRLGLGSVLGYLTAGIIVGPYGLKLIPDFESVMHFSELGVVFLLFVIGLEIELKKLWGMRRHLLGLGGLQVGLTMLIFFILGMQMGLTATSAAVVGFGLSLSSTAFAVQTLTEKNQFNTEFGRSSFSILLMQDLLAIPALAIIPALSLQGSGTVSGAKIIVALLFIGFLIFASRYLIRPVFRMIAAIHSREIFTAVALFIVLSVAAAMEHLGLSAGLGTFLAGVLLADSEYRHELETNIDPFKSLLLGLFFVAVGMNVSLPFILENLPRVLLGVTIYLLVKFVVLYGVGRLFKLHHESSKRMGLSIVQGGEFAFVIFGLAFKNELMTTELVKFLTAVITISMAMSPLLGILGEKIRVLKCKEQALQPQYDEIKDEAPEVVIAGFGRFGQVFGRILRAQNIPFVSIDHDPEQIEMVRKFGNKVYYGDVSRLDLLEAAGVAKAKYFILAVDDVEVSKETAKVIQKHFPHIKLFARARNRGHAYDLMELKVPFIKREVFDSSVYFVQELLVAMGYTKEKASTIVDRFKRHDELMLAEQFKVRADTNALISVSKQSAIQLTQVLSEDDTRSYVDQAKV